MKSANSKKQDKKAMSASRKQTSGGARKSAAARMAGAMKAKPVTKKNTGMKPMGGY